MEKALKHFAVVAADSEVTQAVKDMNAAILACAQGEWDCASELSRKLLDADPEDFAVSTAGFLSLSSLTDYSGIEQLISFIAGTREAKRGRL